MTSRSILLTMVLGALLCAPLAAQKKPPAPAPSPETAAANAHNWLKAQMVSTGLVDSYLDANDVCYTYDQALAVIGFLSRGDQPNAARVLSALAALQNADGSWYHAYACKTGASLHNARYVGAISWVVVAIASYERRTEDVFTYRNMALRALDWITPFMQGDGGINGGLNADGVPFAWASTEHNQDAYSALKYFAYTADSDDVKSFLEAQVWDDAAGRFWQGRDDPLNPLDVNPLGVMALGPVGAFDYRRGLAYADARHRSVQQWRSGKTRINVDGFDFDADKDDVWLEGTSQMSAALRLTGKPADADYFAAQSSKIQQKEGGIPYSVKGSFNGDFTMSKNQAVASTAWLLIALAGLNPLQP